MELIGSVANPIPEGAASGIIRAADGVSLRYARWPATGGRRLGTVCLFQGRAETIEKYFEVVADLRRRGFAVATLDWRGQGGSDRLTGAGRRGHVESFAEYERDLDAFMREVALPDCPPPYYALAHSMGALVCLSAVSAGRVRFTRMVLASPLLSLAPRALTRGPVLGPAMALALFLGLHERPVIGQERYSQDRLAFATNRLTGDPARFERNQTVFRASPNLAVGAPSYGWLHAAVQAMKRVSKPAFGRSIAVPVLLVGAGHDEVVSLTAAEALARNLTAGALVVIPGARHELLMEQDGCRELFWAAFDAFVPGSANL